MKELYDSKHAWQIDVIEIAVDQLPVVFRFVAPGLINRSYNILRPWWELARAPQQWRGELKKIDEIWAPNAFIGAPGQAGVFQPVKDRSG